MKQITTVRNLLLVFALFTCFSCKTNKNGYYRRPVTKYVIQDVQQQRLKSLVKEDTVIMLYLGCSGCINGSEDLFVFSKQDKQTQLERISYSGKFRPVNVSSATVNWKSIIDSVDVYINGPVKYEYPMVDHGGLEGLAIYFGTIKHDILFGPSILEYNQDNINVTLINRLRKLTDSISWVPAEKIKTRKVRLF